MLDEHRFYVYEWYIIGTDKVFYVGKGTGKRRFDISSRNPNFKRLHNDFETESRIVKDNLTEEEAEYLEAKHMLQRKVEGNVLVNTIDEYDYIDWDDFDDQTMNYIDEECDDTEWEQIKSRSIVPYIKVSDFVRCYYGMPNNLQFDTIDIDDLVCFFHLRSTEQRNNRVQEEVSFLKKEIEKAGGKITKSKCKSTKYIVEFDIPDYEEVVEKRNNGFKVIHALDLILFFNNGKTYQYKSKPGY